MRKLREKKTCIYVNTIKKKIFPIFIPKDLFLLITALLKLNQFLPFFLCCLFLLVRFIFPFLLISPIKTMSKILKSIET